MPGFTCSRRRYNAFTYVVDLTGLLFAIFYILTALAALTYFWRRIFSGVWDALILGLLPLVSAGFLGWMVVEGTIQVALPARWTLLGIFVVGLVLMVLSRLLLKSDFYHIRRESDPGVTAS